VILRQLYLQSSLAGASVHREDVQNNGGSIEHLHVQPLLEISLLGWTEFVIGHDCIEAQSAFLLRELAKLASSQVRVGLRLIETLRNRPYDFQAGGLG
jgi:hypothetical protein